MGIYISIVDDHGTVISTNKYGVGYDTLMFTDVKTDIIKDGKTERKKVVLTAKGNDAIDNLNRNIKYLDDNTTPQNKADVLYVRSTLVSLRNKLRPERNYSCDFSEYFLGSNNPEYNPLNLIQEWYDRMNDVIAGYSQYPKFPKDDFVEQAFRIELRRALDCPYGVLLEVNNDINIAYRININLSEGEKEIIRKKFIWEDGDDGGCYTNSYASRKIYHTIRSEIGFTPTSILTVDKLAFFVFFNRSDIENWNKTNPYVFCSYRTNSTYDIEYLLRNTPEEKEKFYCYASWQNAVSIKIDGIEYCGLDEKEVSEHLGKKLQYYECAHSDIIMSPC